MSMKEEDYPLREKKSLLSEIVVLMTRHTRNIFSTDRCLKMTDLRI